MDNRPFKGNGPADRSAPAMPDRSPEGELGQASRPSPQRRRSAALRGVAGQVGRRAAQGVEAAGHASRRAVQGVSAAVSTLRDESSRPRRLLRHRVTRVLVSLLILLGMGFYYLWTYQNGPALAERLAHNFNRRARGRMTIRSVRWTPRAALDILLGRDHKVVVEDLRLYDTKGRLVAHFPRIEAWGKLWPLIWKGDFEVSRAHCRGARFRIDYYRRPDGPNPLSGAEYEIGLISLFEPRRPKTTLPTEPGRYLFNGLRLEQASIELHHESFDLAFAAVDATGALLVTTATRTSPGAVHFFARPKRGTGTLRIGAKTIALRDVEAPVLRTDPSEPTTLRFAVSGRAEGARFRVAADIYHLYGQGEPTLALGGHVTRFAPSLARLLNLPLQGTAETLALQMSGPLKAPRLRLSLEGLAARPRVGGRELPVEDIRAEGRLAHGVLHLDRVSAQALGGAVRFAGRLDLRKLTGTGTLSLRHLRTGPLLTGPRSRELLDGWVTGEVAVSGPLRKRSLDIDRLDLTLDRAGALGALPRRLRLRAAGRYGTGTVEVTRAIVRGAGLQGRLRGRVDVSQGRLRLAVTAQIGRLRAALAQLGLPPLARSASLQAHLRGSWRAPRAHGVATLRHVRVGPVQSPSVSSQFSYRQGEVALTGLLALVAGGRIQGRGRVQVQDPRTHRVSRAPRFRARLRLTGISLARLVPRLPVTGRASGRVDLRGTPRRLRGRVDVSVHAPGALGIRLRSARATVLLDPRQIRLRRLEVLGRDGERLSVQGAIGLRHGALDIRGEMETLPVALLARAAARKGLAGSASGRFHLTGRAAAPLLQAAVRLVRVRLGQLALGRGALTLTPDPATGESALRGTLFDRFSLSGRLTLHPEPRVHLDIAFRDLPAEDLLPPDLPLPGRLAGRLTGRVSVTVHLRRGIERAEAVLQRVQVSLTQTETPGVSGVPGRLVLENDGPVRLRYEGGVLRVLRARLSGSGSRLRLSGEATAAGPAITVMGRISLKPAAWLAARWLDAMQGRLWLRGRLSGPWRKLRWASDLELAGVVLRPVDRPVPVRIASARVHLSDRELVIPASRVAIDTEELAITGRVGLRDFRPTRLGLRVRGKLSGQVLRLLWPYTFNHVSGRARAVIRLSGPVQAPQVEGRVRLEPITFTLRGSGREFSVQSGEVRLSRERITIQELRGSVDEGVYVVDGTLWTRPTWPWDMDLTVRGQAIPIKKPRAYELELNTLLRYQMQDGRARLSGTVDVADGRFTEAFDVVSSAFLRRRTFEEEPAFWETSPLLRDAQLNLSIATRGPLLIKNNLADIRLEGNISLTGTPRKPKIGGRIQTESGTFRIPFLRGEYTVRSGELDFDHPFGFGETYVRIVGETTYTDRSETEHDITLTLEGPLSRIAIKLSSNTGLNQSQILMLLASGRTVDQLRRQARGSDPGPGSTARSSNPLEAYDASLKQVTGDFLSQLLAKPLQAWTRLDLVRLEMGTESFQVRVNKNLGRRIRLAGEAEFGLLGRQRQEGRVEVRIVDQLDVRARARHLIPGEDTVIEEDRYQGRFEVRYRVRLRGSVRRALGF